MIAVHLEPEARAFIRRKGGHLILFEATVTGCCGIGSAPEIQFEVGRPRRPAEEYHTFEVDGVTVHIDRSLEKREGRVHFSLVRDLLWQSLSFNVEVEVQ